MFRLSVGAIGFASLSLWLPPVTFRLSVGAIGFASLSLWLPPVTFRLSVGFFEHLETLLYCHSNSSSLPLWNSPFRKCIFFCLSIWSEDVQYEYKSTLCEVCGRRKSSFGYFLIFYGILMIYTFGIACLGNPAPYLSTEPLASLRSASGSPVTFCCWYCYNNSSILTIFINVYIYILLFIEYVLTIAFLGKMSFSLFFLWFFIYFLVFLSDLKTNSFTSLSLWFPSLTLHHSVELPF